MTSQQKVNANGEYSIFVIMEYYLIVIWNSSRGKTHRLNPYSNGTPPNNLPESILRLSTIHYSKHFSTFNQRVNPYRTIFSQIYSFATVIPNKKQSLSTHSAHLQPLASSQGNSPSKLKTSFAKSSKKSVTQLSDYE